MPGGVWRFSSDGFSFLKEIGSKVMRVGRWKEVLEASSFIIVKSLWGQRGESACPPPSYRLLLRTLHGRQGVS